MTRQPPAMQNMELPAGRRRPLVQSWRATAWVAGVFTLLVGTAMVVAQIQHKSSDPWRSPVLLELKAQLLAQPKNEELKQQIRELDLSLRERYFHLLSLKATGVYLLFGGAMVFLYAGNRVRLLRRQPPMPQADPDGAARLNRRAHGSRNAVAACGVIAFALFSVLAITGSRSPLSDPAALALLTDDARPGAASLYTIPAEELRANWPRFRGPQGSGVAPEGVSLESPPTIEWQAPVPAPGFNSPIVWRDRVLFTGGNAETREVICLQAATGELQWRQTVSLPAPASATEAPEIPEMTGYAASTASTDGERVYAIFATGELAAFTLDGQPVWSKHLGPIDNPYGHAASLACWQDQVIVQLDQGEEESRESKILVFNGRTGELLWQKARPVGASWTTPIVIESAGKPQILTLGLPWVMAYSPADGSELWRAKAVEGEITPSPVFAGDRIFIVDPGMYQLLALRPDGSGDVTRTGELWRVDGDMPDITSPVTDGARLFTLTSDGRLSCFDAATGAGAWKASVEAGGEFQASPSLAGGVLLLVSTAGDLIAIRDGSEFQELWRTQLEDEFYASPAFAKGRLYLRGNRSVWCLGSATATAAKEE